VTVRRVVLLVCAATLALASCTTGSGSANSAAAQKQSAQDAKRAAQALQRAKTRDPGCEFLVAREAKRSIPPPKDLLFLTDAVATPQPCYDKITFTFQSTGADLPPGYDVEYQKPPFTEGPNKSPVETLGSAFLMVTFKPAASSDGRDPARPKQTYLGNLRLALSPDMHHTCIVRHMEDGLGTVNWLIGLDTKRPFTVDAYNNPPRVDVLITSDSPNDHKGC
jgi:hypothetical protein